jgi:PAS domain S-box-containing protein
VSLRWKLLLVIMAASLAVIAVIFVISEMTFIKKFQNIENSNAQLQAESSAKALNSIIQNLNNINHSWAVRDDTYKYVLDPDNNSSYINNNTDDEMFTTDDINYLIILNNSGSIIFSKGYSFNSDQDIPIPQSLYPYLSNQNITQLTANESVTGLILLPEGPLMISSQPIIGNSGPGAVAGTMIMARSLDAVEGLKLYKMVVTPLKIVKVNQDNIPSEVKAVSSSLSLKNSTASQVIDSKTIAGFVLLSDIFGQPAIILEVTIPRDIYAQGTSTTRYFIVSLVILTLLFVAIINFLLSKVVIARVRQVAEYVAGIRSSGDLSQRLKPTGNDEISSLKQGINDMVGTLQESQSSLQMQRKTEQKLRLTIESVAEGIMTTDLKGQVTDLNDSNVLMHGYLNKDEIIGENILNLIVEKDRPMFEEAINKALITGRSSNNEYMMLKANGSTFFGEMSAALFKDSDGEPTGFVIGTKDVTERNNAEASFKSEKELVDRILATVPNAVIVIDAEDKIVLANRTFYDYFGQKTGKVEKQPLQKVIPSAELSSKVSHTRLDGEQKTQFEFKYKINGNEKIFISSILQTEKSETLIMFTDITREKETQERLYLTDRLASVGEMAAGIAHELNNPLTSVIGLSQLLLDDGVSPDIKEDLEGIFSEARRAAAVVKNMLTFARKHAPTRQNAQINNIIEDVLKLRAYEHKLNNIQVKTQFNPGLPEIPVDYFQIQQVFLNIVLNAEHEMIKAHKQGELNIITERNDDYITISFIDDGFGIAPENMRKLFSPFFTTKEVGKGTGLGLSICYGIITNHGGKIYAKSDYGHGATFVIELPVNSNIQGDNNESR